MRAATSDGDSDRRVILRTTATRPDDDFCRCPTTISRSVCCVSVCGPESLCCGRCSAVDCSDYWSPMSTARCRQCELHGDTSIFVNFKDFNLTPRQVRKNSRNKVRNSSRSTVTQNSYWKTAQCYRYYGRFVSLCLQCTLSVFLTAGHASLLCFSQLHFLCSSLFIMQSVSVYLTL